jgi:hypothetical protein
VRLPSYRECPGWRYVYIAVIFIAGGVLGVLLGADQAITWLWFGLAAVFAVRGILEIRRT